MPSLSTEKPFPSKTLPNHHHPRRLDEFEFESIRHVPESHAWSSAVIHDYPSSAPSELDTAPLVDLSSPSRDVVARIGKACESWGAFQVTGHGIPIELLDSLESESRCLFCLPAERKLKAAKSPGSITGYGLPPISSFFSKLMWSEGFTIFGSPIDHARKLWPQDHAHFCEVVEEYNKEMKKTAERLMQLMLLSLGLTEEDINWAAGPAQDFKDTTAALQLNSYPACPEPDRAMGLAAHTDSGLLTILYQSNTVHGLQLLHSDRWVAVPPVRGALIVIIGDLGHVLSNARFKSVLHRAVVNRTHHRISAAYICGPPANVKVSPIGKATDRSLAYRGVTWQEYLGLRAEFFDRALSLIKTTDEDHSSNDKKKGNTCVACV